MLTHHRSALCVSLPWSLLIRRSFSPTHTCTSGRLRPNRMARPSCGLTVMPPVTASTCSVPGTTPAGTPQARLWWVGESTWLPGAVRRSLISASWHLS